MATNTNTNTKRMLGPLARAEEWDDWKYKSTAKLITEGLWQRIAEGQLPPRGNMIDGPLTQAARDEREVLIAEQQAAAAAAATAAAAAEGGSNDAAPAPAPGPA